MQPEGRGARAEESGRTATEKGRLQSVDIALYGLGRMGGNMVTRLARGGHRVVAGNRSPEPVQEAVGHGAIGATSIEDLVRKLKPPRVLWSMVPAGEATDHTLFTRADEVERAWEIVTPILYAPLAVEQYPAGSRGPEKADALITPSRWHLLK